MFKIREHVMAFTGLTPYQLEKMSAVNKIYMRATKKSVKSILEKPLVSLVRCKYLRACITSSMLLDVRTELIKALQWYPPNCLVPTRAPHRLAPYLVKPSKTSFWRRASAKQFTPELPLQSALFTEPP